MIDKQIEEGFDEVKQNQIDAEECQQTRHELSEKNADNREQTTISNDSKRETRWKKRYWSAAIVAIVCVLYVGANMNRQQARIKKLTKAVQQKSVLIEDLSHQIEQKTLKKIWFDRKREHTNEGFQKVDDKYPAGYEVWDGEKLIERWHWRIEGEPKTDQFGEYITRCVALYDEQDMYSGFSQTVMDHFPSENAGETGYYKNNPKPDSIKFTFNTKESTFELVSDDMGIVWEKGKLKHTYLLSSDFKYSWSVNGDKGGVTRELHEIIKTLEHYKYLVHVSKMFGFIDKKIIKPFDEITPEFAVQLELEKSNQPIALTYKQKNEISQSKLNCALAFIHDKPYFWKKVNPEHLNENWENEYKYWILISPRMELHLFDQSIRPANVIPEKDDSL
tara:strand:- start:2133 stop:3305 length:1173 start_codon:yes stop_codon:yes gene_type:complete